MLSWGIPGYTTGQLAWTVKDVVREHPTVKIVFLNGGINDLSLSVPADRVYENQVKTIAWWRAHHVTPVIESTILQVDAPDLNAVLASAGHLRAELSLDGTHLKSEAYPLWARLVSDCLAQLSPADQPKDPAASP